MELIKVHLEEELVKTLFSNCLLLEELAVESCTGIVEILVPSFLDHLKQLKIKIFDNLQTAQIDNNPSIQSLIFHVDSYYWRPWTEHNWKMVEAQNLRRLELINVGITDVLLNGSIPKLVFLDKLRLYNCFSLQIINIASTSLENLELMCCNGIRNLEINCPNLQRFEYEIDRNMWPEHISCNCNTKYQLLVKSESCYSTNEWIYRLRGLLETAGHINISLQDFGISGNINLEAFSKPASVNKLELTLPLEPCHRNTTITIVDVLFSIWHPKYLICHTSSKFLEHNDHFVKVLTRQLIEAAKKIKRPSSSSRSTSHVNYKRWRHQLKGVKARPGGYVDGCHLPR